MWPSIRASDSPTAGPLPLRVILAVLIGRVAEDGVAADDVEGQGLAGQPRRGGDGHGAGQRGRDSAWPR